MVFKGHEEMNREQINEGPLPNRDENPDGLHGRYIISKSDGSPVDDNAEYFVLRLDSGGSDQLHIDACRLAILAYAQAIENHLPQLAGDIRKRYGSEEGDGGQRTRIFDCRRSQSIVADRCLENGGGLHDR